MAHSFKQSTRVPLRPLDDSIRERVEQEYRELHDKYYQYENDTIDLDPSKAASSKFRDTSSPVSPVASIRNLDLEGISLRIYEPYRSSRLVAGVLYIHGGILSSAYRIYAAAEAQTGGYVGGSLDSDEHIPSRICHDNGYVVVSVGYRLAPQCPYPAAVGDCFEALKYMWKNAESLGINQNLIIAVGLSAGGNLATVISLKAPIADPPISVRALITIVAPFDNTATRESTSWKQVSNPPVLGHPKAEKYREYYVGKPESPTFRGTEWQASPLFAPREILRNCPPMLMLVAGVDTYYAEGLAFCQKVQEVDVSVELRIYPKAVHSFLLMDAVLPSGRQGMKDIVDFLKREIEEESGTFVDCMVESAPVHCKV